MSHRGSRAGDFDGGAGLASELEDSGEGAAFCRAEKVDRGRRAVDREGCGINAERWRGTCRRRGCTMRLAIIVRLCLIFDKRNNERF